MLFADLADGVIERRIRGVRSVDSRPVVRRLRQRIGTRHSPWHRGDRDPRRQGFEGTGPYLLGRILDRFLAEYASLNHFTQTVIRTTERGEILRVRRGSAGGGSCEDCRQPHCRAVET